MIKNKLSIILPLILVCVSAALFILCTVSVQADELPENVMFAVTHNAGGEPIGPYYDFEAKDGTRYLFLPEGTGEELKVHCSGDITKVSEGHLDTGAHTVTGTMGAFIASLSDGREIPVVIKRSKIPALEITLNDSLDDIHKDKDKISTGATAVLIDPSDPGSNFVSAGDCEFKGRGNSSWEVYDKKGYQLRLGEARMVLGMDRAKTWVLLANASDPTLLRNKLVFDITRQMDLAFAPEGEFVDLWVNGDYRGVYLLTEKVQIGPNRLDLTSGHGIIAEFDNAFYNNEIYFQDYFGNYFALKDSADPEGLNDFMKFQESVDTLGYLLAKKGDWQEIDARIDAESFARMFLVNEYFANCESAVTSFFWYQDGENDVLHAGPAWDYDTCMRDGLEDPTEYYVYKNTMYNRLLQFTEFQQLITEIYANECQPLFADASNHMYALRDRISSSIDMNYIRWNVLGGTDAKGHESFPSYELNFNDQRTWLRERAEYFSPEGVIGEVVPYAFSMSMSEDGRYVDFYLSSSQRAIAQAEASVWSLAGGAGTATRIRAEREDSDSGLPRWHSRYDLGTSRYIGTFNVQMLADGQPCQPSVEGSFFVSSLPEDTGEYKYEGIDFSPVFDPVYYAMRYPIVRKQVGYDKERLFAHFISTGIKAGYQGNEAFNVLWYREHNEDLAAIYKDSYLSYYEHYLIKGMAEGRPGHP